MNNANAQKLDQNITIKINEQLLRSKDSSGYATYGMSQMWYRESFQKKAGCGPTAATNILIYLDKTGKIKLDKKVESHEDRLKLLYEVWNFVTPGLMGVNRTDIFYNGLSRYANYKNLSLEHQYLNVPNAVGGKLPLPTAIDFISSGLAQGSPVAFLNLINKKQPVLDQWHWTTIVGITFNELKTQANLHIFDGYQQFQLDLDAWLHGSMLGGGFVWMKLK